AHGDITVSGSVQAGMSDGDEYGDVVAIILGTGDITFAGDVDARSSVFTGITGAGDIKVLGDGVEGHDVHAHRGFVYAGVEGKGDITFAGDVTAGQDIELSIKNGQGNITIDEDVVSEAGNVQMVVDDGIITVGDNVTAGQNVAIQAKRGQIVIGEEGQQGDMRDAVIAENNIDLAVKEAGSVTVYGVIHAKTADVAMSAVSENYDAEKGQQNIIIDANSRIQSGNDVKLTATKGDIHVTDAVLAGHDLIVKTVDEGSVFFDTDLEAVNDIDLSADKGDIDVGHQVVSTEGSIKAATGEGNIVIGYTGNGPANAVGIIDTVSAAKDVRLDTDLGKVLIDGGTASQTGDIHIAAASATYTEGGENTNIIIGVTGDIAAKEGSVTLEAENGDIVVTDQVHAKKSLNVTTIGRGEISLGTDVMVDGDINLMTDVGGITVGHQIQSTEGSIKAIVNEKGNIEVGYTGKGNADVADAAVVDTVTAEKDVTLTTALGKVLVKGGTASKAGDIHVAGASA
ncbi:MAG: hypothetical protein IK089_07940, partial [Oxalobacter sp.]|nr:hypothetical protein [Oxalobacter sp.]